MATERLPMRHTREILRLKWGLKRSHREAARSLGISAGAVASVLSRATAIGLTLEALEGLTDDTLEQHLYGPKLAGAVVRRFRIQPGSTRNCGAPASPSSSCTWNTCRSTRTAIAIPPSAGTTASGSGVSACRCGRSTRPATNCLLITPARSRRSSIRSPASYGPVRSLTGAALPPTIAFVRRPAFGPPT